MRTLAIIGLCFSVTSCASMTRGVNNDVEIQYEPADANVRTSLNHQCAASPCTVRIARKDAFQVIAEKEGYVTQIIDVKTRVSGAGAAGFAGNVVAGGVIGMGVDAATGATLEHHPNPVIIKLVPVDAEQLQTAPPVAPSPQAPDALAEPQTS